MASNVGVILTFTLMSGFVKKMNFWVRRKSHLPLIIIGSLIVLVLFFNDETSLSLNMEYERKINELNQEIALCQDSAAFYKAQREAILHDNADLERIARERFHMQRPTEDVFLIK